MTKIYGNILCANLVNIKNDKTGEVTQMTKILYTTEVDSNEEFVGSGILECYVRGNKLKTLETYTKIVDIQGKKSRLVYEIELEEKLIKNGKKLYISKIGDLSLR